MQSTLALFLLIVLSVLPGIAAGDYRHMEAWLDDAFDPPVKDGDSVKKVMIGEVEDIRLLPWGITLPARVDTGATISALDARNVIVHNNVADFEIAKQDGNLRLQLPVVNWIQVRTSTGIDKRPVVELGLCLGTKTLRTLATLSDRSHMTYPFLLGRTALNGTFMVDTSLSKVTRPACSAGSL